jgi:hypothetical protein
MTITRGLTRVTAKRRQNPSLRRANPTSLYRSKAIMPARTGAGYRMTSGLDRGR